MLIQERKPNFERVKEVKVKIPVGMHIKLHSMKVLTGKQISDAVTEALGAYFESTHGRPGLLRPRELSVEAHPLAERPPGPEPQPDIPTHG